ncbi:DUF2510 domain-containing protein [Rhodococcus sp. Q]|uniref:DUF2510 domain-containing protein n=1 Tax=Rhodococcus sp. Q TaxID=2502252 RepID=UPI0010F53C31|nr:DUF2510 domain-containing protein [Rhodococcus sp. Q]
MAASAGWYPNPDGSNSDRHWDGEQWRAVRPRDPQSAEPGPTKKRRQWPWVVAAIVVAGLVITVRADNDDNPRTTRTADKAGSSSQPAQNQPIADVVDPLTTDGTYLVGAEIEPGTYRAQRAQNAPTGYWTRCSTIDCGIITNEDGDKRSTVIDRGIIASQGFIVIEPTDTAVELEGLVLTPTES